MWWRGHVWEKCPRVGREVLNHYQQAPAPLPKKQAVHGVYDGGSLT